MRVHTLSRGHRRRVLGSDYWKRLRDVQYSNLIGLWRLNEAPAGNNYLTFDGSSTSINCGSDATLDDLHDAEFTVEAWVKNDTDAAALNIFISKGYTGGGWGLLTEGSSKPRFQVVAATTNSTSTATSAINDGQWHHLVGYFNDGGDRKANLAVDGVWQTEGGAASGAVVTDAGENLLIGEGINSGKDWEWDGAGGWARISDNDRYDGTNETNFTAPSRTTIPSVDANTVSLWPMDEGYGTTAGDLGTNDNDGTISNGDWGSYPTAVDSSAEGNDGSYIGVNLANAAGPDSVLVPYFDGVNDYMDFYSAAFNSDFNGDLGSISMWLKMSDWAAAQTMLNIEVNNNYEFAINNPVNNRLSIARKANGVTASVQRDSITTTDWLHVGMTWDQSADEFKGYIDGSQEGSTQTGLNAWSGNLSSSRCLIGGSDKGNPTQPANMYAALLAIWTSVLTGDEMADIGTV